MIHWIYVGRDLLHLLWFISPILISFVVGANVELNTKNKDWSATSTTMAMLVAIILQFILVAGYLEGWNIK